MGMGVARLSEPGVAFLKCAFAPPDFNTDPGQGIPDEFTGKTLARKDVLNSAVSFAAGVDTFILVCPTPGVAYWTCTKPTGSFPVAGDFFTPIPFPGFNGMYPAVTASATNRTTHVTAFRYASMCVGMYATSNAMQHGGSITVWKLPLSLSQSVVNDVTAGTSRETLTVNGMSGVAAVGPENYTSSFIEGCYSQSACNEPNFLFTDILENIQQLPLLGNTAVQASMEAGFNAGTDTGAAGFLGLGSMDSICIRVQTPTGAVNSAVLKIWACLELRPAPSSPFYTFAKTSPPLDQLALTEYRALSNALPIAVASKDNATFWERVKSLINTGINVASLVPGPVGLIGRSLQGIRSAISALTL